MEGGQSTASKRTGSEYRNQHCLLLPEQSLIDSINKFPVLVQKFPVRFEQGICSFPGGYSISA